MKTIRLILFPLALVYDFITTLRNFFYNVKVFKSTRFDLPVIAVGNLSVGGTGKTPQIEYLIRLLQDDNKVAVLSRGYKRKTSGFVLLEDHHGAEDVGDEPLQFFKKFSKISVAVDANRVNGIEELKKSVNPDIILLDDAFQHRKVRAGFYILLTKYGDLYSNDFLLPTGNLRESRRGASRADAIVVTKCPNDLSDEGKLKIKEKLRIDRPIFFSTISYAETTKGSQHIQLNELKDYEVLLVTGIANPTPLLAFLSEQECKVNHLKFPDHHRFSDQEIAQIQAKFDVVSSEKKLLLTTEKDYMRLSGKLNELSYLEIESEFDKDGKDFNQIISQYCNTNS